MATMTKQFKADQINAGLDIFFDLDEKYQHAKRLEIEIKAKLPGVSVKGLSEAVLETIKGKHITTAVRRDALIDAFLQYGALKDQFDALKAEIAADPNKYLPEQE